MSPVNYIPLLSTLVSFSFSYVLFRHWRHKKSFYVLWWMLGVITYGLGTLSESINTLGGWHEVNFKIWYIVGALLGGAPLAQGTVYLLTGKKIGHILTTILVSYVIFASISVILSPVNYDLVTARLTGKVMEWHWVRMLSIPVNLYALVFLVGGAIYSAIKYSMEKHGKARMIGNICIAVGALLPGIGGTATRFGHVEVLYVTELLGLIFIMTGYYTIRNDNYGSVHKAQSTEATESESQPA